MRLRKTCPTCGKRYWFFHFLCRVMPRGNYVEPSEPWPRARESFPDIPPGKPITALRFTDSKSVIEEPRSEDSSMMTGLVVGAALSSIASDPPPQRSAMDDISTAVDKAGLYDASPAPVLENPDPTPISSPDPVMPDPTPLPDPPATDASNAC